MYELKEIETRRRGTSYQVVRNRMKAHQNLMKKGKANDAVH